MGLASHIGLTLRALADALPRDPAARVQPWLAGVRKKETDAQARLMAERLSDDYLIVRLDRRDDDVRVITLEPHGAWVGRLGKIAFAR